MIPMYKGKVNSPQTTLLENINASQTNIKLVDFSILPPAPNIFTILDENNVETVFYASSPVGGSVTVQRGFQGTAKAWDAGTTCLRTFTEYDYGALVDNVNLIVTDTPSNISRNPDGYITLLSRYGLNYQVNRDSENNITSVEVI